MSSATDLIEQAAFDEELRQRRAVASADLIAERLAAILPPAPPLPVYEGASPVGVPSTPHQEVIFGPNGSDVADSVYVVRGGYALWPLSVMCRLVASGVVADRTVALEYRLGDGSRYVVQGTQAVVQAGVTQSFCWYHEAGGVAWPIEDAALAPLSQQHVYPGNQLALKIWNGQTGDVLDTVRISARFDPLAGET